MEGPWIVQYVGLSPMSWMGVDDVTSVSKVQSVNPARSGRNREISSTAPLTGSKGSLGFRRRVKFTTEEARSYNTRGSELQGREREISDVCCVVREATVPQERLDVWRTRWRRRVRQLWCMCIIQQGYQRECTCIERSRVFLGPLRAEFFRRR